MRKLHFILIVTTCLFINGCSAFRLQHYSDVTVNCQPGDAIATVNNEQKPSPAVFTVPRDKNVEASCQKVGYQPKKQEIKTKLNATGWLDTVGGYLLLIPYVGVLTPGAWTLESNDINISLDQEPATAAEQ